jgi:membrane-associated phospholipid phosphatase
VDVGALDRRLLVRLAAARRPWLDPIVGAYSRLGDYGVGWVAVGAIAGAVRREPALAVTTATAVWATLGANYAIKSFVGRQRPQPELAEALVRKPSSPSFPSAHAAMTVVAVSVLGRAAPGAVPALVVAGAAMIVSRVYLAVHYPSDVLAGAVVGAAAAGVVVLATR